MPRWRSSGKHHVNEEWPLQRKPFKRLRKLVVNRKLSVVFESYLKVKVPFVKEARSLRGTLRESLSRGIRVVPEFLVNI